MRLEKPGGLYGFYFVYLIGIGYAASIAEPLPSPVFVLSTSATLLAWNVLRGAVCIQYTINDNLDRGYDRQVARCRTRPIARGAVTPTEGYVWFVAQSFIAAAIVKQQPFSTQCFHHAIPIHSSRPECPSSLGSLHFLHRHWNRSYDNANGRNCYCYHVLLCVLGGLNYYTGLC